jgi:hypothetical protein
MSLTVPPSLLAPRWLLLALLVAAIALTCLPQVAAAAPFGVQKLREGASTGPENYVYTDGGTVFAQATVDAGSYYRFTVLDSSGTTRSSSNCIQALFKKGANYKYAIQPTDPVTTGNGWRFKVEEWNNLACSGAPAKTSSLYFTIARERLRRLGADHAARNVLLRLECLRDGGRAGAAEGQPVRERAVGLADHLGAPEWVHGLRQHRRG